MVQTTKDNEPDTVKENVIWYSIKGADPAGTGKVGDPFGRYAPNR